MQRAPPPPRRCRANVLQACSSVADMCARAALFVAFVLSPACCTTGGHGFRLHSSESSAAAAAAAASAPLSAKTLSLSGSGVYTAEPLSFAIIESSLAPQTPAPPPPPPPVAPPAPTPPPSPVLCPTCKRPRWSWATVGDMSFAHLSNESGAWSEEALDVLAKFPMVTIEVYDHTYLTLTLIGRN